MTKKVLIVLGALILLIVGLVVFSSYRSYKISKEKCGDLSKQQGAEFVYIEGSGCVAKEATGGQKKYDNEQAREKGAGGAYLAEVDKSISVNMRGMMVNAIENYKKEKGSYSGFATSLTNGVNNKFCTSKITYQISPDGTKYTMYQPLCSNTEKIYCMDNTSDSIQELEKTEIANIEKNYSCK